MLFSVIIRTRNEARLLQRALAAVAAQGYDRDALEIIIVDSGSTDATCTIAAAAGARIIAIPYADFSYPYASNVGVRAASGTYTVFLSGHSILIRPTALADTLAWWRTVEGISTTPLAGVYGPVVALPGRDSSIWEKLFFSAYHQRHAQPRIVTQACMGLLGCTNAIIRRDLLMAIPFDEHYGLGGEDTAWAAARISDGYGIGFVPALAAYHSHGLGIRGLYHQWHHWHANATPQSFDAARMQYRQSGHTKCH